MKYLIVLFLALIVSCVPVTTGQCGEVYHGCDSPYENPVTDSLIDSSSYGLILPYGYDCWDKRGDTNSLMCDYSLPTWIDTLVVEEPVGYEHTIVPLGYQCHRDLYLYSSIICNKVGISSLYDLEPQGYILQREFMPTSLVDDVFNESDTLILFQDAESLTQFAINQFDSSTSELLNVGLSNRDFSKITVVYYYVGTDYTNEHLSIANHNFNSQTNVLDFKLMPKPNCNEKTRIYMGYIFLVLPKTEEIELTFGEEDIRHCHYYEPVTE